jgi:hypothetical protein
VGVMEDQHFGHAPPSVTASRRRLPAGVEQIEGGGGRSRDTSWIATASRQVAGIEGQNAEAERVTSLFCSY